MRRCTGGKLSGMRSFKLGQSRRNAGAGLGGGQAVSFPRLVSHRGWPTTVPGRPTLFQTDPCALPRPPKQRQNTDQTKTHPPPPPYVTPRAPHFTRDDTDIHPHYRMEWNHVSIERNIPFFPPFQFIVVSLQEINNNTKKKNSDTCPFLFLLSLSLLPFNALLFLGDGVRRAMHSTRPSTMLIGIEVSRTTTTFHQLCRSTTDRPPRTRE